MIWDWDRRRRRGEGEKTGEKEENVEEERVRRGHDGGEGREDGPKGGKCGRREGARGT